MQDESANVEKNGLRSGEREDEERCVLPAGFAYFLVKAGTVAGASAASHPAAWSVLRGKPTPCRVYTLSRRFFSAIQYTPAKAGVAATLVVVHRPLLWPCAPRSL